MEGFAESKVDPLERRSGQLIPALVAEGSRGWDGKGSLIEPLVRTAVLQLRVPDHIGKPIESYYHASEYELVPLAMTAVKGWPL